MINLGIIGGGSGGVSILELVEGMPNVKLKWIADIDENAPAMQKAKEKGIETTTDFLPKVADTTLELAIEVTGNEKVQHALAENGHKDLSIIDAIGARFLVDIVEQRQKMIEEIHQQAEVLSNNAEALNESTVQIRQSMEELAKDAEELARGGEDLSGTANEASKAVANTNEILKFIQDIANQTNIIGLNASIEAARVGNEGRGFTVVAEEIRKLADNSSSSVKQISEITDNIVQYIEKINEGIQSSSETAQNQAAATEEVLSSLENLASISNEMKGMADKLVQIT